MFSLWGSSSLLCYSFTTSCEPTSAQHTAVSDSEKCTALPRSLSSVGCFVCVRAATTASPRKGAGRGIPGPAPDPGSTPEIRSALDPPSASANVFAGWGRQLFCGLFHVGVESRPGLTLALLGQRPRGGRR